MLIVFFVVYTNILLNNIKRDVQIVPDLYSRFVGLPANVNLEHFLFQYFMEEVLPGIDYPIILVDSLKIPFSWENIDIERKKFSELDPKQQKILLKMAKKMESQNSPIPLKFNQHDEKVYGYVYFGDSETIKRLKLMPYIEMILILIFVLLGVYGIYTIKRNERDILWVGLAKETAHQFGTPLSSLSGWLNILSMKIEEKGNDPEMLTMLNYMNVDIDRLNKIASRFGKVGSDIEHQKYNLHNIILDTIDHFKRRLPSISNKITIKFESKIEEKDIRIDPDLIKWTLENVIKNSIDAMQNKGGKITVKAFSLNNKIFIHIKDEGNGLPKAKFKKIFYPGITSKERGWGLGLSLAKRIVEEYHDGKIRVLKSELGKGTTFEIVLPEV
ncbi:MAG: hypothetical protein KAU01_02915 [Candidatus Cloacimonetes bacterium]|nr:hypothetical protein [Candidatus Cloacimonadota bacterium]